MTLKVWSLFDLMKLFRLMQLSLAIKQIGEHQHTCEQKRSASPNGGATKLDNLDLSFITGTLEQAEEFCKDVGWSAAQTKITLVNTHLEYHGEDADYSTMCADLRNCLDMIMSEAWQQRAIQIDSAYRNYVNNDALFGEDVSEAFPSAIGDIKEAGNCIAVESGTAAVFHLMRAVEWGLRALCVHLGITRIRKSRKPGKKKYIPYQYAQWEKMLEQVQEKTDARINKLGPGKRKQDAQEFYYPLLRDLKGFKDAWRNHVMHTRAEYSQKQADDICDHVKAFMAALATKVSEI